MKTMTEAEYMALVGTKPQRRPCPNPACIDGWNTWTNIALGSDAVVHPLCATCGGIGAVLVTPAH